MQRRHFIKQTATAISALSLPFVRNNALAESPAILPSAGNNALTETYTAITGQAAGYKKAIMWGTVGMEGTVSEKCKAIKAAGFAGIEPNSHMDRKEVIDAMKANGLTASSVCCSTHWNKPLTSPDAAIRQEGIEGAIVTLEDVHAYRADAILLVVGAVNEDVPYDVCWNRSVEGIKKILPTAEKLKVQICIENVGNRFLLSPLEAVQYVDQFNSPYVKWYFDVGNIMSSGWPEQWINILGNRIARIHIKEYSSKTDEQGRRVRAPLADGEVNWPKVMEAIRKNYGGAWLITEIGSNRTLEEMKDLNDRFDRILIL